MNIKTLYGTVYGVANLEEAQQILAAAEAERDHEGCPDCRNALDYSTCPQMRTGLSSTHREKRT